MMIKIMLVMNDDENGGDNDDKHSYDNNKD